MGQKVGRCENKYIDVKRNRFSCVGVSYGDEM